MDPAALPTIRPIDRRMQRGQYDIDVPPVERLINAPKQLLSLIHSFRFTRQNEHRQWPKHCPPNHTDGENKQGLHCHLALARKELVQ
jgi:hypothetical protein